MPRSTQTTIDQWATLQAVVECGGYAQAAERLNRSQSAISYAVGRLQERLGVRLLEVEGRKARLTEIGAAMLAEAIPLVEDLVRLEYRGRLLSQGEEPRVRLSVEAVFPKPRLFDALAAFRRSHGHVRVELRENTRGTVQSEQIEGFDLAILGWQDSGRPGLPIARIEMLAVAHRDHELHRRPGPLSQATLARHLGVHIQGNTGTGALPEGEHWRVNTIEAAIEAVARGLCFGWLPRHQIAGLLAAGLLVPLPLEAGATRTIPLVLVHADAEQAGPATRALAAELLKSAVPDSD